ncbi:MAG: mannose-1-phosphate guanylyltransferase [Acidobacteria bacterium]|nr:mannose-1-phosphate guanylyltransferase [Acidobacteriota bacterium]
MSKSEKLQAHAIILAGGRGTRFWPRSRTRTPKQLLNIVGKNTMLAQTMERLRSVFPASRVWVVTNATQAAAVRKNLPGVSASRVLAEPAGRNTAAAIGLAAVHLAQQSKDALMAVLPADHYIANAELYRKIVAAALEVASQGRYLVALGIPPAGPETGYGYIECADATPAVLGSPVFRVRRFTEKPAQDMAQEYVASGRYLWNAGMFFWRVSTFLDRLKKYLPATHDALMRLADTIGTRRYAATLKRIYPKLENISVDYAVMERATQPGEPPGVFVLPAEIGWSDIGSWAAVYDLQAKAAGENVSAGAHFAMDASGNFFWSQEKFVAAIGVRDLIVVETPDALLICPRDRAQDVGKVVKWLEQNKRKQLL